MYSFEEFRWEDKSWCTIGVDWKSWPIYFCSCINIEFSGKRIFLLTVKWNFHVSVSSNFDNSIWATKVDVHSLVSYCTQHHHVLYLGTLSRHECVSTRLFFQLITSNVIKSFSFLWKMRRNFRFDNFPILTLEKHWI